jgi:hypothetical protein
MASIPDTMYGKVKKNPASSILYPKRFWSTADPIPMELGTAIHKSMQHAAVKKNGAFIEVMSLIRLIDSFLRGEVV